VADTNTLVNGVEWGHGFGSALKILSVVYAWLAAHYAEHLYANDSAPQRDERAPSQR
jgi:hypothetical protein